MKKLLIITPIKHIEGCYEKLSNIKDCSLIYLPDCTKNQFLKNKDANYIFTNPNKSKIILDKNALKTFNELEVICTASTGTNHIDLKLCTKIHDCINTFLYICKKNSNIKDCDECKIERW